MIYLTIASIILLLLSAATLITVFSIKVSDDHKASKNSWHYNLYEFISFSGTGWDKVSTPITVCQYFWLMIIKLFLLPLTMPVLLMGVIWKKLRTPSLFVLAVIVFWLVQAFIILAGTAATNSFDGGFSFLKVYFAGTIILMLTSFAVTLLWIIINYIEDKRENSIKKKRKFLLVSMFKAWKEKNCPYINWE